MQLVCKHCGQVCKSLEIVRDKAVVEVMVQITQHISTQHKDIAQKILQRGIAVGQYAPTLIILSECTTLLEVPEGDEKELIASFNDTVERVKEMLGVELFINEESEEAEEDGLGEPLDTEPDVIDIKQTQSTQ